MANPRPLLKEEDSTVEPPPRATLRPLASVGQFSDLRATAY